MRDDPLSKGLEGPRPGEIEMSRLPVQPTPAAPAAASESPTNALPGLVPINPPMAGPESSVPASDPPRGVAAIAPAAPHLQAQASPAPVAPLRGILTGPNGEKAVFLSDEEFDRDFLKESHTLHIGIASICSGLSLIIYAGIGMAGAGPLGGIGLAVLGAVLLGVSVAVGTGAAWIVGKLFGEDFGAFGILMLRVCAVVSAQFLVLMGFAAVVGPILAMLVSLPVLLFLAVWLLGMNIFQAFVFTIVMKILEWILLIFVALSIASAVMS